MDIPTAKRRNFAGSVRFEWVNVGGRSGSKEVPSQIILAKTTILSMSRKVSSDLVLHYQVYWDFVISGRVSIRLGAYLGKQTSQGRCF